MLLGRRPSRGDQGAELARWRQLFTWSACLTAPVFLVAMVLPWVPGLEPVLEARVFGFPLDELVKCAFVTPVQFCIGWRFHVGAWNALRNGRRVPSAPFASCLFYNILICNQNMFLREMHQRHAS